MDNNTITKVEEKNVDTGCVIIGIFGIILLVALAAAAMKQEEEETEDEKRKRVFDEMSKDFDEVWTK